MCAGEATGLAYAVVVNMLAGETTSAAHAIFIRPVMSVGYVASSSTGLASTALVRPVMRAGEAAPLANAVIVGVLAALAADAAVALRAIPTVRTLVTAVFADTARINMLAVGIAAGRAVAGAILLCPLVSVNHIASCLTFRAGAAVVRPVMRALKAASFAHAVVVNMLAGETADAAHAVFLRPVMSVQYAARCAANLAAALRAVPVMRADEVAVLANTIGVSMSANRGTLLAGANAVHIRPDVFFACILRFTYGALDEFAAENRHIPFVNAYLLAIIADTVVPRMGFLLHSANLTLAVVAVVLPTVRAGSAAFRAFAGRAVPLAGVCADIAAVLASAADVNVFAADCAAFLAGANTIHIRPGMFRTAGTQQFAYYALAVAFRNIIAVGASLFAIETGTVIPIMVSRGLTERTYTTVTVIRPVVRAFGGFCSLFRFTVRLSDKLYLFFRFSDCLVNFFNRVFRNCRNRFLRVLMLMHVFFD